MKRIYKLRHESSGFTLIELMLVTVIIGILAGTVVVVFTGSATDARIDQARGEIKMYEGALELFALDNNDTYPNSLALLATGKKQYIRDLDMDPWNNPYNYEKPGRKHPKSYDLYSSGPDGQKGTGDDIAEWIKNEK